MIALPLVSIAHWEQEGGIQDSFYGVTEMGMEKKNLNQVWDQKKKLEIFNFERRGSTQATPRTSAMVRGHPRHALEAGSR